VLLPLVREALRGLSRRELLDRLSAASIPCGEVLGMYEALTSQRTAQAGLLHSFDDSQAGRQTVLAPPYVMDGERTPVRRPPPHLGQHTDEVLREVLAMDDQAIAAARAQQAI
jgi:crotonobetainyl-CoA:carnitine CoA-transferase CaiB-like acyl-CoA transferase